MVHNNNLPLRRAAPVSGRGGGWRGTHRPARAPRKGGACGDRFECQSDRSQTAPLPARAKNVIFMFMSGAPSQYDLFYPKPELQKWDGRPLPASLTKDLKLAFIKPTAEVWASPRVFQKHGQSGMEFSDFLPHHGRLRRRLEHDSLDVDGSVQSPSGPAHAGLRQPSGGPARHGLMGPVRPGQRVRQSPGLRRAHFRRPAGGRQQAVVSRVSPFDLPGRALPQHRRPGALPLELARDLAGHCSARVWTPCAT